MRFGERLGRFIDHGAFQTFLGLLGGLLGTFLDGVLLVILAPIPSYALERSGALDGLSARARRVWRLLVVAFVAAVLFRLGTYINQHRPQTYTPDDYAKAVRNGLPLPAAPQVLHEPLPAEKLSVTPKPQHAHIVFLPPELFTEGANYPYRVQVNVFYQNQSPSVVLHAKLNAQASFGSLDDRGACNKGFFILFKQAADFTDLGPMFGAGIGGLHTFQPANPPPPPGGESQVLYLTANIRWRDDSGEYDTDYFGYFQPIDGNWHSCAVFNGESRTKAHRVR